MNDGRWEDALRRAASGAGPFCGNWPKCPSRMPTAYLYRAMPPIPLFLNTPPTPQTMVKIKWVNHASYVLEYGSLKLITDPWIEGRYLTGVGNTWHLPFSRTTILGTLRTSGFLHEHPDHFFRPTFPKFPKRTENASRCSFNIRWTIRWLILPQDALRAGTGNAAFSTLHLGGRGYRHERDGEQRHRFVAVPENRYLFAAQPERLRVQNRRGTATSKTGRRNRGCAVYPVFVRQLGRQPVPTMPPKVGRPSAKNRK